MVSLLYVLSLTPHSREKITEAPCTAHFNSIGFLQDVHLLTAAAQSVRLKKKKKKDLGASVLIYYLFCCAQTFEINVVEKGMAHLYRLIF